MTQRVVYFLILFSILISAKGQSRYSITTGTLNFTSNASLEVIKASSNQVQGLIDPTNNQFAFKIPVTSFKGFNSELQREHFNEKYMESERYSNVNFSGKIIEQINFDQDGTYEVRAKGDLDIHGVKQNRIIKSTIVIKGGTLTIESHFRVPLSDHNISIPSIVSQKIATEIAVDFNASMKKQP